MQVWTTARDDEAPLLAFLEWIEPFVESADEAPESHVGWYKEEGDAAPTLIFHDRVAKQLVLGA